MKFTKLKSGFRAETLKLLLFSRNALFRAQPRQNPKGQLVPRAPGQREEAGQHAARGSAFLSVPSGTACRLLCLRGSGGAGQPLCAPEAAPPLARAGPAPEMLPSARPPADMGAAWGTPHARFGSW